MSKRAKKQPAAAPVDPYPVVVEAFRPPSLWNMASTPSAINSISIERYRITVERIEEPREVLAERLRKLWRDTAPNGHHTDGFRAWAKKLGIELDDAERGKDAMGERHCHALAALDQRGEGEA